MQNNLNKVREIYFKYFLSQKMALHQGDGPKAWAMMGMPLVPSFCGKPVGKKSGKGKTSWIGIKRLNKIWPKSIHWSCQHEKKIQASHKDPPWNMPVSKINGVTDTKTTISMTSTRYLAMRAWVLLNTSGGSISTTWDLAEVYVIHV